MSAFVKVQFAHFKLDAYIFTFYINWPRVIAVFLVESGDLHKHITISIIYCVE